MLFHDIKKPTAEALDGILTELEKDGYKFVHVVSNTNYQPNPELIARADVFRNTPETATITGRWLASPKEQVKDGSVDVMHTEWIDLQIANEKLSRRSDAVPPTPPCTSDSPPLVTPLAAGQPPVMFADPNPSGRRKLSNMTQDEALQILKTGANVFLTGEPGSGKSYAAARYVSYLRRENIPVSITASTGIAAAQLGGTTVHAWSGIGTRSTSTRADLDCHRRKTGALPIASKKRAC